MAFMLRWLFAYSSRYHVRGISYNDLNCRTSLSWDVCMCAFLLWGATQEPKSNYRSSPVPDEVEPGRSMT